MSKQTDEMKRLLYWIQTIQSYVKNPMIIIVGTHLDSLKDKKNQLQVIEEGLGTLKVIIIVFTLSCFTSVLFCGGYVQ